MEGKLFVWHLPLNMTERHDVIERLPRYSAKPFNAFIMFKPGMPKLPTRLRTLFEAYIPQMILDI